MREDGFTLAEVLASLVLLSLLAIAMGNLTQSYLMSWERTDRAIAKSNTRLTALQDIEAIEQGVRETGAPNALVQSNSADGNTLLLATPKIDQRADCVFDQIGRRCR